MGASITLVELSYSPWSERARWALDHHRIPYRKLEHVPFIGELRLRRIVGRRRERATVPVLVDGDTVITESWDIAKYADSRGTGAPLIPASVEPEIRQWTDVADQAMVDARALVVAALTASDAALDETLPFPTPSWVVPALRPFTRFGMRWFARKYRLPANVTAEHEDRLRPALERLRRAVQRTAYVTGAFSYADIAMATLLQGISPVGNGFIRLGPATRRAWTRPALEREYADLIRWRDRLYAQHRSAVRAGGA